MWPQLWHSGTGTELSEELNEWIAPGPYYQIFLKL